MALYKLPKRLPPTTLTVNQEYEGITIEQRIRLIMNNKEPISDGAPLIYTDRKNGVEPEYNIKTDKWDIAIDAMDKVHEKHQWDRQERQKNREPKPIQTPGETQNSSEAT